MGGAPVRCSRSDGRMIYRVNEAITRMMLRRLEKSRVVCYIDEWMCLTIYHYS